MALCSSFCVTAVESPDPFSSKGSGLPFTILWICDTLMVEGVPLEILAAGSPVWLLISSPSAETVPLRDSPLWVPRRPVSSIPDPLWKQRQTLVRRIQSVREKTLSH